MLMTGWLVGACFAAQRKAALLEWVGASVCPGRTAADLVLAVTVPLVFHGPGTQCDRLLMYCVRGDGHLNFV